MGGVRSEGHPAKKGDHRDEYDSYEDIMAQPQGNTPTTRMYGWSVGKGGELDDDRDMERVQGDGHPAKEGDKKMDVLVYQQMVLLTLDV